MVLDAALAACCGAFGHTASCRSVVEFTATRYGFRGLLRKPGRGRATNCHEAGGLYGRGGPPAGYRRFVRAGGVQREPQNSRDRYSHGALGAASSDVLRLVMGKGLVLVGFGVAIGLAMGFAVEQLMNSMLFNAGGVDIVAYIIVVPSLFLVTMLAAYVPARRASRIAPTVALRYE